MKKIKTLHPLAGEMIDRFLVVAKNQADAKTDVQFDFNGIKCVVSRTTDLSLMLRDYHAAFALGWKEIGPNPVRKYDEKTQAAVNEWLSGQRKKWAARRISATSSYLSKIEKIFEQ